MYSNPNIIATGKNWAISVQSGYTVMRRNISQTQPSLALRFIVLWQELQTQMPPGSRLLA